ncbi:MAG: hypothetical protein U9Q84_02340 [Thermodesulfobacteriota bacterium]|nr:hypothetical protein [Thermodesulfobacteriota bacterium]
MFPFSFEWAWDMGHMIFMGGLWYALTIIGLGMAYCIIKAIVDTAGGKGGH